MQIWAILISLVFCHLNDIHELKGNSRNSQVTTMLAPNKARCLATPGERLERNSENNAAMERKGKERKTPSNNCQTINHLSNQSKRYAAQARRRDLL